MRNKAPLAGRGITVFFEEIRCNSAEWVIYCKKMTGHVKTRGRVCVKWRCSCVRDISEV